MKKRIGSYFFCFMLVTCGFSCDNEKIIPNADTESVGRNHTESSTVPENLPSNSSRLSLPSIGVLHNQKLEEIFTELKNRLAVAKTSGSNLQPASIHQITYNAIRRIFPLKKDSKFVSIGINEYQTAFAISDASRLREVNLTRVNSNKSLSADFKNTYSYIISEIDKISSHSDKDIKCAQFNRLITQKLKGTEKEIMLSGVDLFSYSYNYWETNLPKWKNLARNPNLIPSSVNEKRIGEGDLQGMISGAITGAVIGGTTTLGAATVPGWLGGAITGAVAGSAAEAVRALWDFFS